MAFQSLQNVLGVLGNQYQPQSQRQFQVVLRCWIEVVGPVVAAQTRPLTIQRGVLKVATASSAWAQNLVFERQRILAKLNGLLPQPLEDIRFSHAQWESAKTPLPLPGMEYQTTLWQQHPSRVSQAIGPAHPARNATDPLAAFRGWASMMRTRSQHLPTCPRCQSPTPPGELERWSMCAICVAKQW